MSLIFNYGPQSDWEWSTGGTNCFLRDGGPLFHQFCLKNLYSWVGRGGGLVLHDWPDGEVQRIKVRALCRPDSLLMNEGIFLWIHNWVILEPWEGAEFCCRDQGTSLELLLGPEQQVALQNVGDVALGVKLDYRGYKKQSLCDGSPNPWQTADFCVWWWRRRSQNRSFCWFTTCWMLNFFSSVNTRFGSVPSAIS